MPEYWLILAHISFFSFFRHIELISFYNSCCACLWSMTNVTLTKYTSPRFRLAKVTGFSTTPWAFICSTTMGAQPSPLIVERMGPVYSWYVTALTYIKDCLQETITAPKLSYFQYCNETTQFRCTFSCNKGTYVIIEFIAKASMSIGNNQKGKENGFPAMEVGIETGKINKNKWKEKNLRNSHDLGDEHAENSCCPCIWPA